MHDPTAEERIIESDGIEAVGRVDSKGRDVSAESAALSIFKKVHPIGFVAAGALVAAIIGHVAFDTDRIVGNMSWWQWLVLIVTIALATVPASLHTIRLGIESIATMAGKTVWVAAWLIFIVQMINVVTRYLNPFFESDILIGELTSFAWQLFAFVALMGLPYGIKVSVNPRIDFWWADWSDRKKAWLDFVMHTFFFLPFLYAINGILVDFAASALGRKRGDGSWPDGWRVWNSWEQSTDADQLPFGPVKALILVGFTFFALQIVAEIIKTGFVLMGRGDHGDVASGDEFQRIE
jgi:TRAP-type mannitol/chloroaromatic compound transport system permease small subunit